MSALWIVFLLALLGFLVAVVLALRGIGVTARPTDDKGESE